MRLLFIVLALINLTTIAHADDRFLPIQEIKTPGGLTAWLVTDGSLPLISMEFAFKDAGAKNNNLSQQGLAKLLSNMLDEGAGELKSQEFQKQLSDQSIGLSFSSSRDNFLGNLTTLKRYQNQAFSLLKLSLDSPRFDAEPLERMRQANIARLKSSLGNPNWIAQRIFNDVAFQNHPYALNAGGTISTLNKITASDLKQYKETQLTKDRLIIGVAGDISKQELIPLLDKIFSNLPNKQTSNQKNKFNLRNTGKTYLYQKDIPQSIIIQALNSIPIDDKDYSALQLLNYIFGSSGFGSRLMAEAREKRGLTYGVYSSIDNMDDINLLQISTSTDNQNALQMLEVIEQEVKKLLEDITNQEIQDAKSYITGSLPLALSSTSGIAGIITSMQLNNRPIDYLDTYNSRVNAITKADLMRVAIRIFKDKSPITVIVGQPASIETENIIKEIPNAE